MSLKIKDSVDLKELGKFEFEITNNNWEKRGEDCFEAIFEAENTIKIIIHNRHIFLRMEGFTEYDDTELDILYDLIKADLIEKI